MSRFHRRGRQTHGALCLPALHFARSPFHYRCLLSDTSDPGYRLDLLKDSFGETVEISFTIPNACVVRSDCSVCRLQMEDGLPRFHRHRHQTSIVFQKTQAMTVFIILNEQLIGSSKHGGVVCFWNSLRVLKFLFGASFETVSASVLAATFQMACWTSMGEMRQLGSDSTNESSFIQPSLRVVANPSIVRTHWSNNGHAARILGRPISCATAIPAVAFLKFFPINFSNR